MLPLTSLSTNGHCIFTGLHNRFIYRFAKYLSKYFVSESWELYIVSAVLDCECERGSVGCFRC